MSVISAIWRTFDGESAPYRNHNPSERALYDVAPRWLFALTATVEVSTLALLVVHNVLAMNLSTTHSWPFTAQTVELMTVVSKTIAERWPNREIKMRTSWQLAPSMEF